MTRNTQAARNPFRVKFARNSSTDANQRYKTADASSVLRFSPRAQTTLSNTQTVLRARGEKSEATPEARRRAQRDKSEFPRANTQLCSAASRRAIKLRLFGEMRTFERAKAMQTYIRADLVLISFEFAEIVRRKSGFVDDTTDAEISAKLYDKNNSLSALRRRTNPFNCLPSA